MKDLERTKLRNQTKESYKVLNHNKQRRYANKNYSKFMPQDGILQLKPI